MQRGGEPVTEFVPITNQCHAKAEADQRSEETNNHSLTKENPDDLRNVCTERLHNSDLASLLDGHGDERAHNAKSGNDDDEKQQKEHYVPLKSDRLEDLPVHLNPRLGELWDG